ncbi:unnamed protein product [Didymodactylos carnosus]|uniref:Amino acid transporter n=1 Tax=Didymodactylos carnosus TaxID=1234261 RepID=A0A814X9U0_9BILA|nr:unnamed protein product [Didymodactylos carnosus]CAF3972541.1 unnamed protein product [Didymodactylos carnosus]
MCGTIVVAVVQISSTISILITIVAVAKRLASAHVVFFSTINVTGFSFPYVCLIGILPTLFGFSGYEAASHLCEETRNAEKFAPIGILGTCICTSVIGFAYLLSLMFASYNPLDLVQNILNPSAAVQIYKISTPLPVALLFTVLLIINLYFAGMSATTVSSRTGYAMARDSVFPGSRWLKILYKRSQTPVLCVLLVFMVNVLLLLLNLFSTTAFAAIVSISTIGFQISYMLPILFRITHSRNTFLLGQFNLGRFGVPIGVLSVLWLFITSVILLFPFNYPITAQNMNWSIVVISGITIIAGLYWILSARRRFVGPKRMERFRKPTITTLVAVSAIITEEIIETRL